MDQESINRMKELFDEVLESYIAAEEFIMDERGGDFNSLKKEKEEYKKEFEELIQKISSLK